MKETRFRQVGFWISLFGMFLAAASCSWGQDQSHPVVVKASRQAFAPPLSQLIPIPPRSQSSADEDEEHDLPLRKAHGASLVKDSVLQESSDATLAQTASLAATPGLDLLGMGYGFPGYSEQAIVPDTNAAVGPTQVVQWVNESFTVFNKSNGSVAYGPADGNTLWQAIGGYCYTTNNLDIIVQFDKLAQRWVMMMPVLGYPYYFCAAVSTTSDILNGGWNLYYFQEPITASCGCRLGPDYPKWGVWPDAYYLSFNQGDNGKFMGAAVCAVNRNSMLNGTAATMQCFLNTPSSYGALLPADVDGTTAPPAGSPEYFMNFDGNDQSLDLWQFHVNWTTPSSSTFTGPTNIPVAAFIEPCGETVTEMMYTTGDCIPQAGTSQGLDSIGDRLMYRLAYRNFGSYAALVVNHTVAIGTSSTQTGVRWYELQNTGSGFGLYQQGTYAPDVSYRWMGSIAMDHVGDIALGYSVSGSNMNPSIRYTGRVSSDPLGEMEGEVDILSLANVPNFSQTNTFRWGDYSSMAIDPTDDCTFWYTTEYHPSNNSNYWATRLASFNFPACTQLDTLTVSEVGQGTVTSTDGNINCTNGSGSCSAAYASGSSVTLDATAASNWAFSSWSGPCTGGNPCSVVMNADLNATATFTTSGWTLVNDASGFGNPLTSLTIPSTGSGHLIAVGLMFNKGASVASVTDNAGNSYVSAGARAVKGTAVTEIWYAVNSKAGATVLTPRFSGSPTHVEVTEWEVSGLLNSTPDKTSIATGTVTVDNTPGPAVTTKQPGDFIVSIMFAPTTNFTSISSGNAFTDDFTTDGNGWAHITSNGAAAGTYQASWYTTAPSGGYCGSTVAFLAAN